MGRWWRRVKSVETSRRKIVVIRGVGLVVRVEVLIVLRMLRALGFRPCAAVSATTLRRRRGGLVGRHHLRLRKLDWLLLHKPPPPPPLLRTHRLLTILLREALILVLVTKMQLLKRDYRGKSEPQLCSSVLESPPWRMAAAVTMSMHIKV